MTDTIQNHLKKITLFVDLPDDMIAQLAGEVKEQSYAAGEVLFNEGSAGDALYFIQSGEVEIYQASDGKIFERLKEGDYFGEMALLETEPRSASARVRVEASLLRLEQAAFMALLKKNPELGLKMTQRISARLRMSMASSQPSVTETKTATKSNTETKVFISYSRRDKEFVLKLNEAVSTHGIDTWVDWENIPLTADWWSEIRLGIENADAFAFVISPDSLNSEVCGREVQTAVDNNKRLIPILHRDPQKGDPMPEKISSHNWIYMRDDAELTANVPQMLTAINTDLGFVRTHTRLLERALEWERASKNASFHLQGDDLQNAENWLQSAGNKQPKPTALHIEYIQASRRATTQRQRTIMTASLIGLGIAVILAIISFVFFLQAREAKQVADEKREIAVTAEAVANEQASLAATAKAEAEVAQADAETERDNAEEARQAAVTAQAEAVTQANLAATREAEAKAAQAEAVTQKGIAEDKALLAKAGDLAASGLTLVESNPPLAILLALESDRLSPDNPTAQDVFSLIPIYFPPLKEAFIDPAQNVGELAWSSTGQLASSSGTNIIIWNLGTYEPEEIFPAEGAITTLAWAPDGRLATGDENGVIMLWNVETGENEKISHPETLKRTGQIESLAWHPRFELSPTELDYGFILTYAVADTIVVEQLDPTTLSPNFPATIIRNRVKVNAIAWGNTNTPPLAAGLDDGSVAIWFVDIANAKPINSRNFKDHEAGVISIAFAPNGSLATGSRDSTVVTRDSNFNSRVILKGHTDYVNALAWSDDNQLASGSWDKTVILWDLEKKVAKRVFRGHSSSVNALDWGPEGKLTSGADFIYVWDTASNNSLTTYPGHLDWTYSVQWTPQGQLVSEGGDSKVIFWDQETQKPAESLPDVYSYENLVIFSETRLLTGNYLIDREEKKNYSFPGYSHIFSPDGNSVVGLSETQMVLWPLAPLFETGELITETLTLEVDPEVAANMWVVTWSPDGKTIATGHFDGTILLWDFNSGGPSVSLRATLPGHPGGIKTMAWSQDGRLASAGYDAEGVQTIIVWDIATQAQEKVITTKNDNEKDEDKTIYQMSWGLNGQLASISGDNNILVWDVNKGEKIATLGAPYRAPITSVAWSPDGKKIAFGGQSYNVYVYDTTYIKDPCTWLTRNMTYSEWHTYLPNDPYQATCPNNPFGTAFEDEANAYLANGEIELGIQKFQELEAQEYEIDVWSWNNLCWYGSLYNQAEISSFACDRAVELLPDDGDIRDSRGVSRALLGDFAGAIEDFEAFIAYGQDYYSEDVLDLRRQWIEALQAGNNPFDEATLASLRGE